MTRLINADDIKYTDMLAPMGNGNYEHVGIVTEPEIDALPTVDAVPVVHGEWIDRNGSIVSPFWERYECSECGARSDNSKYCPNCGADMRG